MSEKGKAFLITGAGLLLWTINNQWIISGTQSDITNSPFGILGNAISTVLFIYGIVKIVQVYRKKSS